MNQVGHMLLVRTVAKIHNGNSWHRLNDKGSER